MGNTISAYVESRIAELLQGGMSDPAVASLMHVDGQTVAARRLRLFGLPDIAVKRLKTRFRGGACGNEPLSP